MKKFSTRHLDEALRRKKRQRERMREDVVERALAAIGELSKTVHFDKAYLFGSSAKSGRFDERSDIDIGFMGLKDGDVVRAMAFLSREMGVDVDVVQLEGHRLAGRIKEGIEWKRDG